MRFEPKRFKQRRPDGHGAWIWKRDGIPAFPYRLPELLSAPCKEPVFIVEGEKDVDNLLNLGLIATTIPQGAGCRASWAEPNVSEFLRRRHVVIIPDNDSAGREFATAAAAGLQGKAASIRWLELPHLPEKGDVSDWLDL